MHTLGLPNYPADSHDFGLPERLHRQLRESAESHFRVSRMYAKLAKIFPGKIIQDERIFDDFIRYYGLLPDGCETIYPDTNEEYRIKHILWNVIKFCGHDIKNLFPYGWHGNAKLFLSEPLIHIPRVHDALCNLQDVTEGVGVFLSPDTPPLYEFDAGEVLSRVFRKLQLRNENHKYDPTGRTREKHLKYEEIDLRERQEILTSGVKEISSDRVDLSDTFYRANSCESIFDCVEFDLHLGDRPMIVEQGNRGTIFTIIYNILKNGYKLVEKFSDYSPTLQALHRDLALKGEDNWIRDEINRLGKVNTENRLFREEIERRGGKLRLSGEVVDAGEAYVIHVWDNAAGFDLNGIKSWIKKVIETDYAHFLEICADPVLSATLRDGISQWIKNPHASNIVMAHMSEFIKLARFSQAGSSGMGMYGSQVLSHKLGGSVIAAEMATGGAFFSIIVPKDARKWIKNPERETTEYQFDVAKKAAQILAA